MTRPVTTTEYDLSALSAEVEIIVDSWGVPHIYAQTVSDVFIAQGFNAARDRLFQIDLWRRRGNGRLAEVLGAAYLEQDRANRQLLFRGDMVAEWSSYGPQTQPIVADFVAGVNAYVLLTRSEPDLLPPEFAIYGYLPSLWEPDDVVRFRTHGLFYNVEQEIARAQTVRDFGLEVEELRQAREPADPLRIPDGLDLSLFDDDMMRLYRLAFSPVNFAGQAEVADWRQATSGSNNWVIDASRTATGRPILANDPHRAVTLPALRYMAHLDAPGLSVIGAGEPGLPGISIGHNGQLAFGLTIWPADLEDLYLYELDPSDAGCYRYGTGWEPFTVIEEEIAVAGQDPVLTALMFTRHGPVIYHDAERGIAVALRAAWLEPGMAPYLASVEYMNAQSGDEFIEALEYWGAPAVSQVFASADGEIGCQASGRIPRRKGWDGSAPVPGDGRYEWDGFARTSALPAARDPESGWIQTANEMNLPAGYRNDELTITYDWYSFARADRLREWLAHEQSVSVNDCVRMQTDSLSVHALRICESLKFVDIETITEREIVESLRSWDGDEHVDSFDALVFEVWLRRHLRPWLVEEHMTRRGFSPLEIEKAKRVLLRDESFGGDLRTEIRMLDDLELHRPDRALTFTQAVEATLSEALADIASMIGPDRSTWTWGSLHQAELFHPALAAVEGVEPQWARLGPVARGGSGDTVGNTGYDSRFRQTIGSTFRMVIDVGEWDSSRAMNSPGQSADPRSAHYADLFGPWARGESFPLLYSRAAVEAHAETRIRLRPKAPLLA